MVLTLKFVAALLVANAATVLAVSPSTSNAAALQAREEGLAVREALYSILEARDIDDDLLVSRGLVTAWRDYKRGKKQRLGSQEQQIASSSGSASGGSDPSASGGGYQRRALQYIEAREPKRGPPYATFEARDMDDLLSREPLFKWVGDLRRGRKERKNAKEQRIAQANAGAGAGPSSNAGAGPSSSEGSDPSASGGYQRRALEYVEAREPRSNADWYGPRYRRHVEAREPALFGREED